MSNVTHLERQLFKVKVCFGFSFLNIASCLKRASVNLIPPLRPQYSFEKVQLQLLFNCIPNGTVFNPSTPWRKNTQFWLIWLNVFLKLNQNFLSKTRLKIFLIDNQCQTLYGSVGSECYSCKLFNKENKNVVVQMEHLQEKYFAEMSDWIMEIRCVKWSIG